MQSRLFAAAGGLGLALMAGTASAHQCYPHHRLGYVSYYRPVTRYVTRTIVVRERAWAPVRRRYWRSYGDYRRYSYYPRDYGYYPSYGFYEPAYADYGRYYGGYYGGWGGGDWRWRHRRHGHGEWKHHGWYDD
jgi:hypothetical protein